MPLLRNKRTFASAFRPLGLIIVVALFFGAVFAQDHVDNEVLVKISSGGESRGISRLSREGYSDVKRIGKTDWYLVKLSDRQTIADALRSLGRYDTILGVQPNFIYRLHQIPNDPQWDTTGLYGLQRISAPAAWDITTGSPEVVVANIDTGMRLTHEDLAANIWVNPGEIPNNGIDDDNNGFIDDVHGWDFRFNDNDPSDQHGHGTHTGGTIGAVGNNALGVVGVNWNVRIMPIKIFSQAANDTTSAMLIAAYDYVRMMKERGVNIRVANNSYGGCPEACGYDQATKDAIDALGDAGVLNVFSAGNAGSNVELSPFYPGSYDSPSILNVAASNFSDGRASFSNFGLISVDVAAPGAGIQSTTNGSNSSYGPMGGTSMAAPHVSGVAALLAAHHPHLSAASIKATIMNSSDQLAAWSGVVRSGGRLNAANALLSPTICNFDPSMKTVALPTKGGSFVATINAAANCDYSVATDVNWISIFGPKTRSSTSKIEFWVRINPTISRQGVVRIGDRELLVTQTR